MERQILHLRVISFPVAVYRVKDPSLRQRPILVAAGRGPRAVVLSVSDEARDDGARPGMTLPEALRWCRRGLVLPPDPVLFERAEKALAEILCRFAPIVEPVRGGRLFADLTGTARLLGAPVDLARRVQKEIDRSLRLGPNAGLGVNKLISGVAARVPRPVGLLDILPGQEVGFLSPLPVSHLPAVDPRTDGRLLDDLNIHKVRDLGALDLPHLSLAFGARGVTLYRQARGIDESPVRPPDRALVAEADETFAEDTNDDAVLLGCLYALVERCGARLRALGLCAREARLTVRYSDGVTVSRGASLSPPVARDLSLFAGVRPLFDQVAGRRGRVRYLRVRCAKLTAAARQPGLFDEPLPDREGPLIAAIDRLRGRFGEKAVAFGRSRFGERGLPPSIQEARDAA